MREKEMQQILRQAQALKKEEMKLAEAKRERARQLMSEVE